MVRPKATELTQRELAVMRVFWEHAPMTADQAREKLASQKSASGESTELAYVTVANVVRSLFDKGFLEAVNEERPFLYKPLKSFEDVSRTLVGDLVQRLFDGSREQLLAQMFNKRKLTKLERAALQEILDRQGEQ
jgi:BlaI family transcriptional regulator, penicillinase repressor